MWCTSSLAFNNCTLCPHCIYVFRIYLRTNSGLCHWQHKLTGFYNRDEKCLQRGTDWVFIYNSTFCPHSVFMCFVWIWEQTAIISLYSINWLVFITETECVYCAVRTGSLYIILRSARTVYLCVLCVWIWEQTAIISLYSINWLVFITETECLLRGTDWVFIYNSTFCPHRVFMCFVWISEQTAITSLYNINWLVFMTEMECVYCKVRTGSLYRVFNLKVDR